MKKQHMIQRDIEELIARWEKETGRALLGRAQLASALTDYLAMLQEWNQKINLVSRQSTAADLLRHVWESLQYIVVLGEEGRVMDIGSGAGFPGIPVKLALPACRMTLVESRGKRAEFLRAAVARLGLQNVTVENSRAEELAQNAAQRGQYDHVMMRAVAGLEKSLKWGAPFLAPGGQIVVKKDPAEQAPEKLLRQLQLKLKQERTVAIRDGNSKLMVFTRMFHVEQ